MTKFPDEGIIVNGTILGSDDRLAISKVLESESACFSELVAISGLNKRRSFREVDLRGVNFDRSDLRGFDFTNSNLSNTKWRGARYDRSTILEGADLQGATGRNFLTRYRHFLEPGLLRIPRAEDISSVARTINGVLGAEFLRLVFQTTSFQIHPENIRRITQERSCIFVVWSGQHYLLPYWLRGLRGPINMLIDSDSDSDFAAVAAARMGTRPLRGRGGSHEMFRKRGISAFQQMMAALSEEESVLLPADVPKRARECGNGVIVLAQRSGRPIVPVAIATSRRIVLQTWDRAVINLPFGSGAVVFGEPINVNEFADNDVKSRTRAKAQDELNRVTSLANRLVGIR
jgi:lysophospholipid acyltransferase (LPLAT)-like uncharacterized protein